VIETAGAEERKGRVRNWVFPGLESFMDANVLIRAAIFNGRASRVMKRRGSFDVGT